MHEVALAHDILTQVAAIPVVAGGAIVTRVRLRVGALRSIDPESLRWAFRAHARGTPLESAELAVEVAEAAAECRACGAGFGVDELVFVCPECGSGDCGTTSGLEMILDSIEIEEAVVYQNLSGTIREEG